MNIPNPEETTTARLSSSQVISQRESETFAFGEGLGRELTGGEIILLDGPLGAGKTILVKGIASALGIDQEEVTSPSFSLVNPHHGRLLLYHIDLYRLDAGASAAHAVDLDEILTDESAVVIIEWAERLGHYPLPGNAYRISITGDGDEPRRIAISSYDWNPKRRHQVSEPGAVATGCQKR